MCPVLVHRNWFLPKECHQEEEKTTIECSWQTVVVNGDYRQLPVVNGGQRGLTVKHINENSVKQWRRVRRGGFALLPGSRRRPLSLKSTDKIAKVPRCIVRTVCALSTTVLC